MNEFPGRWTRLSKIDLHLHTTASDGKLSPAQLVSKAAALGLTLIAITDHDTVDGIDAALAAARDFPGLTVIPGVEINADVPHGEAHILGYFIDYTNRELIEALGKLRESREKRAVGMVAKLGKLGLNLDWQRVQEIAGGSPIGRPHIALALLEKGYIRSIKEAFVKYIGRDGPAYVEREKITPVGAVELILRCNGLPVLAHPTTINDPEAMIIELKAAGLVGIEAYYGNYTADQVDRLVNLARKHNLITTGGSDYHGLDESAETMIGGAAVPEAARQLIALAEQRALKSV
ncbi:MAG: PHP domain-containing protein [Chloroflexota bacterium]|nr:PHP domain-containing protein [Chloroflexota bacterium]